MSKNIFIIAVIALVLGGGYVYYASAKPASRATSKAKVFPTLPVVAKEATETPRNTSLEFIVDATSFSFSMKEIRVKQGDKVKITVNNREGFHDWVLDGYSVRTKQLKAGASERVQFTASKKGTFEYYCSVGTHRKQGMAGKFIVE